MILEHTSVTFIRLKETRSNFHAAWPIILCWIRTHHPSVLTLDGLVRKSCLKCSWAQFSPPIDFESTSLCSDSSHCRPSTVLRESRAGFKKWHAHYFHASRFIRTHATVIPQLRWRLRTGVNLPRKKFVRIFSRQIHLNMNAPLGKIKLSAKNCLWLISAT